MVSDLSQQIITEATGLKQGFFFLSHLNRPGQNDSIELCFPQGSKGESLAFQLLMALGVPSLLVWR
ncbi:hypothetical protein ACQP3F_31295, partial [Escherichia coli]